MIAAVAIWMSLLTAAPEQTGAAVLVTRRTGATLEVSKLVERQLRAALAEASVDSAITPGELSHRLLSLGVKDSASCEGKKPCVLELARQLKLPLLISVSVGQIAQDVSLRLELLRISDGARLADATMVLEAARLRAGHEVFGPFARQVQGLVGAPAEPRVVEEPKVVAPPVAPVAAPAPAPAPSPVDAEEKNPSADLGGTHFDLTVRGQLAPVTARLTGAWVVHAAFVISDVFAIGGGVIIARPYGAMLRASLVPFNADGRVRPKIALEVPVLFGAVGGPTVGVGGSVGVELRLLRNLAIGAEIPVSYYFGGSGQFFYFGALSVSGRL